MSDKSNYHCPYCASRFEVHEALKAHVVAEHRTDPLPKPHGVITFTINGQLYEQKVEPEWTSTIYFTTNSASPAPSRCATRRLRIMHGDHER